MGAPRKPAQAGRIIDTDALDDFAKVFWNAALDALLEDDTDKHKTDDQPAMTKKVRKCK